MKVLITCVVRGGQWQDTRRAICFQAGDLGSDLIRLNCENTKWTSQPPSFAVCRIFIGWFYTWFTKLYDAHRKIVSQESGRPNIQKLSERTLQSTCLSATEEKTQWLHVSASSYFLQLTFISWFQAFAVFRMLFVFFWVIPRRLIYKFMIYKSDAGELLSFLSFRLCIRTNHAATLEVLWSAPMKIASSWDVTPCVSANKGDSIYQSPRRHVMEETDFLKRPNSCPARPIFKII